MFKGVHTSSEEKPFDPAFTFIFHKVTNSLVSYKSDTVASTDPNTIKSVFGHFDMAVYLNETCLYYPNHLHRDASTSSSQDRDSATIVCNYEKKTSNSFLEEEEENRIAIQNRIAMNALKLLTAMKLSRINETMFMTRKEKYKHLLNYYVYFSPIDCILNNKSVS